ncbi:hypothetical protein PDIG_55680 [Penicillium digitatum PHI26]|uniref:Uncharacterized protein n=2 Tax=Penicillium digitatum TaxID=36651 RepID=K9G6W4_PEND2|nr:hypothetical protein PDIP_87540 [Penicillium digitatum Pd1]EKV04387.1 hypothetical protein PDIP_87540 [Penicillium digitatum Pd1]EKV10563.1 hypothetical protein PDIG_55680 [Penicillium digitatum PHI26]
MDIQWPIQGLERNCVALLDCTVGVSAVLLLIAALGAVLSCWLLSLEVNPHLCAINFRVTTGIFTANP